jgi:N-acetylglucosaminyldiphosphoundecaprenol N-acetyl-beta-D-mannosaminyltransferase
VGTTVEVLGVPVHPVTWPELRDYVCERIERRARTTVMYANVHVLNSAHRTPALLHALRDADLVYCDGEGVRLAARLLGERLPARMTGADFISEMFGALAAIQARVYWLGAAPGVADRALRTLAAEHPGVSIAGARDGYFTKDGGDTEAVISALNACRADIVFVGMGTPAQELWVARYRDRISAPVVWCIGATADFVAGVQPRGPDVLTQHGLEWLARLASDPRRLWSRYVIGNPLFIARVVRSRLHRRG